MTNTLTMMRGYPASGKSTIAKGLATNRPETIRVCRDDLRLMILDSYWTGKPEDEDVITIAEKALVNRFLDKGYNVVLDATNLRPVDFQRWESIAFAHDAAFDVFNVTTSVYECIRRDTNRGLDGGRMVGTDVIERMARNYPIESWVVESE